MDKSHFLDAAERFLADREGCPDDPHINKATCPKCISELMLDAYTRGIDVSLQVGREEVMAVVDDIFGADSPYYQQIKSRLEDL